MCRVSLSEKSMSIIEAWGYSTLHFTFDRLDPVVLVVVVVTLVDVDLRLNPSSPSTFLLFLSLSGSPMSCAETSASESRLRLEGLGANCIPAARMNAPAAEGVLPSTGRALFLVDARAVKSTRGPCELSLEAFRSRLFGSVELVEDWRDNGWLRRATLAGFNLRVASIVSFCSVLEKATGGGARVTDWPLLEGAASSVLGGTVARLEEATGPGVRYFDSGLLENSRFVIFGCERGGLLEEAIEAVVRGCIVGFGLASRMATVFMKLGLAQAFASCSTSITGDIALLSCFGETAEGTSLLINFASPVEDKCSVPLVPGGTCGSDGATNLGRACIESTVPTLTPRGCPDCSLGSCDAW